MALQDRRLEEIFLPDSFNLPASSALQGRRILLTRPDDEGSDVFIAQLRQQGALVEQLPLIEVSLLPVDWPDLSEFDWVFLTSKNAAKALLAVHDAIGLRQLPIAVVGPATRQVLASNGLEAAFVSPVFDAESAAKAFCHQYSAQGLRVLWPNGNLANPELSEVLRQSGAQVTPLTVYQTGLKAQLTPAEQAVLASGFDVLVFTSPSAVQAFRRLNTGLLTNQKAPQVACLGPKTSQAALREFGRVNIEAHPYTLQALGEAIQSYFESQNPSGASK